MFNAARISGSGTERYKLYEENFFGVDTVSPDDAVLPGRARDMRNFVREKIGVVSKRSGFVKDILYDSTSDTVNFTKVENFGGYYFCTIENADKTYDLRIYNSNEFSLNGEFYLNDLIEKRSDKEYAFDFINTFTFSDSLYVFARGTRTDYKYRELIIAKFEQDELGKLVMTSDGKPAVKSVIDPQLSAGENMFESGGENRLYIKIPVIVIGASPKGGGTVNENPNMLTPCVTESFCVSESDLENDLENNVCKRFQCSMKNWTMIKPEGIADGNELVRKSYTAATFKNDKNNKFVDKDGCLTELGAEILNHSVKIEVYKKNVNTDGSYDYEWQTLKNLFEAGKKDYANPVNGGVWIPSAAIGASPVAGQDNVRITYIRNLYQFNREDIWNVFYSSMTVQFGINGYKDRIFYVCNNNRVYYSEMDDALNIGELNFLELGPNGTKIMVIAGVGNYLYAVDQSGMTYVVAGKAVTSDDSNTFLSDSLFVIADRLQGAPPVKKGNATIMGEEFCYLSTEGLTAIRHDNYYDTRHVECRSRLLDGAWQNENLENAVMIKDGDFLYIALGIKIYLLDEKQTSTLKEFPYSGKQYEAYIWELQEDFVKDKKENGYAENIINVWREGEKVIWWNGRSKLYLEPGQNYDIDNFNSETKYAINAYWQTPDITKYDFLKKKEIIRLAVSVGNVDDMFKLEYRINNGSFRVFEPYRARFVQFDYGKINYDFFTYRTNIEKLYKFFNFWRSRRYASISLRVVNDREDYGLTLKKLGYQYTQEVL